MEVIFRCATIIVNNEDVELTDEWKEKFNNAYLELGGLGERVLGNFMIHFACLKLFLSTIFFFGTIPCFGLGAQITPPRLFFYIFF